MRSIPLLLLLLLALVAAACQGGEQSQERPTTPRAVAERFLALWKDRKYGQMYNLISTKSQKDISRNKFVGRYEAIAEEATITGINYRVSRDVSGDTTRVPVKVTISTSFFGDVVQSNTIPLVRDRVKVQPSPGSDGEPEVREEWRVRWRPSLIFKELDDRTLVHFFTRVPRRGAIYDGKGKPLAVDAELPVVGIVPELIIDKEATIAALSAALGVPSYDVRAEVEAQVPSYYFVPVKVLDYGTTQQQLQPFFALRDLGVVVDKVVRRVYPYGDAAAHVLGYMREVTAEELRELAPKGYRPGDRVGALGLEAKYEKELAGERGGILATITPEGTVARRIIEKPEKQGLDIFITIDVTVQKSVEESLGQREGSVVVLDPRDNSVLALASYPRFNPDDFIEGLSQEEANALFNDPRQPLLHRPLLGMYPTGSTFKVVTMAAGLEQGGFSPYSTLPCPPVWVGPGENFVRKNWQTYDRGSLTPAEGLMASCNSVFYEMALTLDLKDPEILPRFARAFGFGAVTGIGLEEAEGVAPGPEWKEKTLGEPWYSGDAVNLGIGQGFLLATPLQIANAYSAIAGGGVLREPLLIRKIASPDGAVSRKFETKTIRPLPVSESTLAAIREGLRLVTQSPGGTGYGAFAGSTIDASGKSGTAEDLAFGSQQAFFVGYAPSSSPSVLTLVHVEHVWSSEAAPIARRILEAYLSSGSAASAAP
ncbi:MAG: penicillin-binding protein 2 [Chloroflexi bacterium]|nr:penicillin-binding protein 2 [Chloroflexota bacterium]